MPAFKEARRRLVFDDATWNVIRYDAPGEAYRTLVAKIPGTKAVDFAGLHESEGRVTVLLLEVTDYATDPKALRDRTADQSLACEFAQKVLGTLGGLVYLCRVESSADIYRRMTMALSRPETQMRCVLWICDCPIPERKLHTQIHTMNQNLKKLLRIQGLRTFAVVDPAHAAIPNLVINSV